MSCLSLPSSRILILILRIIIVVSWSSGWNDRGYHELRSIYYVSPCLQEPGHHHPSSNGRRRFWLTPPTSTGWNRIRMSDSNRNDAGRSHWKLQGRKYINTCNCRISALDIWEGATRDKRHAKQRMDQRRTSREQFKQKTPRDGPELKQFLSEGTLTLS